MNVQYCTHSITAMVMTIESLTIPNNPPPHPQPNPHQPQVRAGLPPDCPALH